MSIRPSQPTTRALGIDFGTTNSALAVIDDSGLPQLARFPTGDGETETFRSILYFESREARPTISPRAGGKDTAFAGPDAVTHYRQASHKGRFIQSLKSYLGDPGFTGTVIGGRRRTVEELIGLIVRRLLAAAEKTLGPLPTRAVVGRPVHFTDARSDEEDAFALGRLREALRLGGVTDPIFEYEPVAAAYAYQRRLREPATVLIGDFGGGTSDFSILSLRPSTSSGSAAITILGNEGVAIGGDRFDRRIVRHAIAPQLGKGSEYVSPPDKVLPTPEWVYSKLERWHHLSFLKTASTIDMLQRVQRTSTAPDRIAALLHLIDENLGYELHEHVTMTKTTLSSALETELRFDLHPVAIAWHATRVEFERWLEPELVAIEDCVDQLLARTGLAASAIDRVFLTGGSSFVPAVGEIFRRKFGAERITGGHELTSVATGLALRAAAGQADRAHA